MSTSSCRATNAKAGRKDDKGKNRLDLLPAKAILVLGEVLTHGAAKYADNNWKQVPDHKKRYLAALLRHTFAYMNGETVDPETKLHHLGHAMACASFLIEREGE